MSNGGESGGDRPTARIGSMRAFDPIETGLTLEVARRFYLEDQSKVEIAEALKLSRFQVARILADARRDGIVRIEVGTPGYLDRRLGARVADALGIPEATVIHVERGPDTSALDLIGQALAVTLGDVVADGDLVGLTWSRAIEAMTLRLTALQPCTVVQLAGAVSFRGEYMGSVEIIRRVAVIAGGIPKPIYAPLIVDDARVAEGLRRHAEISEVLALASRLDVAVTSIGSWRAMGSAVYDLMSDEERLDLASRGAVGEVSGRIFDLEGRPVASDLDERIIGVNLKELAAAHRTITTSYGAHRAEATRAAVRAGLVGTLILDNFLAEALLAAPGAEAGRS